MSSYTFTESFDRNALFHITRNFSKVFKNPRNVPEKELKGILTSLRYYLKTANEDGTISINYHPKSYGVGRLYANPSALQNMPREIRNAIAKDFVNDIDVVNCHPVILSQMCAKNDIPCPTLDRYVADRDAWLSAINPDSRSEAKRLMITLMYGGDVPESVTSPDIIAFHAELHNITQAFALMPENKRFAKVAKDKRYNQGGSFLSYMLQDIENAVLMKCISYCRANDIRIHSLIYDGFTASKEDTLDLAALSNFVYEEIGYRCQFVVKPMESSIIIPNNILDLSVRITYDAMKANFEAHCSKVMNPIVFLDDGMVLSREQIRTKYENLSFHKAKNEVWELKSFIVEWLKDPEMRTFETLGLYPPPLVCPDNCYNMYQKYEWEEYGGVADGDTQWFLDFLKIMVNNDSDSYAYVLPWIAHIIQLPGIKTETLLAFVGSEGIGKSTLIRILMKLFGQKKVMETNNPENTIFGRFANWSDKTLCVLNDFNPAETRGAQREMFKQFITEVNLTREKKGIDSYETQNYTNFIVTANTYNIVHKTEDSRRYMAIEVSNEKKGDFAYFDDLNKCIDDDSKIAGLFNYLKRLDLSGFNARKPPGTAIGDIISQENQNPIETFVSESKGRIHSMIHYRREDGERGFVKCKEGDEGCVQVVGQRDLFSMFLSWCSRNNIDTKKCNSKKLQTEIYRKRHSYKMEYRANKNNSCLSMWVVNDISYWEVPDSGEDEEN